MNQVQEAIARVTGLDDEIGSMKSEMGGMAEVMEHLVSDNVMLQRQIEDLDYLNLFDMNQIGEILPMGDRKKTLQRLRRLRHDNPLAKQAVKLMIRFTLGKGVQWVLARSPELAAQAATPPKPGEEPKQTQRPPLPTRFVQLPRQARAAEAEDDTEDAGDTPDTSPTDGTSVVDDGDNDRIRDIIESFWEDGDNQLALTSHSAMKVMLDETITDGEKFYACFEDKSEPYIKVSEIPIEEITTIIYDMNNRLRPVYYRRQYQELTYDGESEMLKPKGQPVIKYYLDHRITEEIFAEVTKGIKIPKGKIDQKAKIFHSKINEIPTRDGKRGLSELYASREWFRVFREFMEGRASINAAAQAISYVRKIKGGPTSVASFSGKFGGLDVGDSGANQGNEISKLTKPIKGAIYDTNPAVDLDWLKTDTGAQNAKEDARMLLMSAGAGVGTMIHYFGEGGDANLATAQSMELPMVKSYEDWQQFIEDFYTQLLYYVLRVATDEETAQDDISRVGFNFPPIISQDVVKYTTSWSQIVRDIAPNNMAVKRQAILMSLGVMGVPNIDGLMPEIEAEMVKAEQMRQEQQRQMAEALAQAPQAMPPPNGNGNGATKIPTSGESPDFKRIASGKPERVSNGPKPV